MLQEQHPDLLELPLVELDSGWDNKLFRLGDELVVRLPRRAAAAPLLVNEQRWLGELAPRLPLPVPAPVRLGRPSNRFPWCWSVVPWLEGCPGDSAVIADPVATARILARFLRALHTEAPPDAPHNPYRSVPLSERAEGFETWIAELATEVDVAAIRRVWEWAVAAPPRTGPNLWIHGDLHPANTLFTDGSLSAVIDFGDLCAGDPATDVAGVWMLLPASALPAFRDAYGLEADLERRAIGWAVLFALMQVSIGIGGRPSYEAVGRAALDSLLGVRNPGDQRHFSQDHRDIGP